MLRIKKREPPTTGGPAPGETRVVEAAIKQPSAAPPGAAMTAQTFKPVEPEKAPEPADLASILTRIESKINAIAKALKEAGLEIEETEAPPAPTPAPTADAPAVHPLDSPEVKQGLALDADDVAALKAAGFNNLEDIVSQDPDNPDPRLTSEYGRKANDHIRNARKLAASL